MASQRAVTWSGVAILTVVMGLMAWTQGLVAAAVAGLLLLCIGYHDERITQLRDRLDHQQAVIDRHERVIDQAASVIVDDPPRRPPH